MEQSIGKANSGRFLGRKMQISITLRALWWAIRAHRGQQWPEGHFTRSQVERGRVPYGTIIVFWVKTWPAGTLATLPKA